MDHVRSVHAGAGFAGFAEASAPLSQRAKLVVLLGSLLAPAGIGGFAMRDALTLPALETFVLFGKWLCVAMMVGAAVYAMYVATFDETKQLSKMKLWHTVVFYFATTLFIAALSAAAYFIRLQWAIGWNLAFFASVAWYRVVYGHDYEHIVSHLFVIDKYGVVLLYFFFSCLKYEAKLFVVRRAFFWLCLRTLGVLLIFFFHTDKASGKKWSHRGAMGIFAGIILANAIAMDGPFKFSPFLELFVPPDVEGAMSNTIVVLSCSVLIFLVFFVLKRSGGSTCRASQQWDGTVLEPILIHVDFCI